MKAGKKGEIIELNICNDAR